MTAIRLTCSALNMMGDCKLKLKKTNENLRKSIDLFGSGVIFPEHSGTSKQAGIF